MRFVARAALGGWLLPLFFALFASFAAAPAQAQAPIQTVVVLDFDVANGLDPLLGRKAADGLAVELKRSEDFEVVTRQRVDEAVGQQAGLQPPFNDTAQIRLAQAVGARSVFSGRVAFVTVDPGRLARVALEVRQLDAGTGDYINGTQVSESTEQKLAPVANEILIDEAINKATFSASRSIRQTTLPEGNVLNTTRDDVELSIGSRNGVAVGQRYSVLRDVFNRAKQITERVKIAELTIARVESDGSTAVLSAGGAVGVRTNDRVRKIFVATNYSLSALAREGNSVTPVTAPPIRPSGEGSSGGIGGLARKSGRGALGILALAGLIGLVGAGGGGGSSSSSPRVDQPVLSNPSSDYPQASITFSSGFTGFNRTLQSESVVGYLIFRGTADDFTADINTLQGFVDGRNSGSSSQRISFSDPPISSRRLVTITAVAPAAGTAGGGSVNITDTVAGAGNDTLTENQTTVTLNFTQRPTTIGQTYFYRVGRITAERLNTTGTTAAATVQLMPARSRVSRPSGGFTALLRPQVVQELTPYDTDNFSVRVNYDPQPFIANLNFLLPVGGVNVATGADQFRVQVSTSTSFSDVTTFTSPDLPPNNSLPNADQVFNLGNIRIPDNNNAYVPNLTPLYVRVLSRNSTDAVPTFRISKTLAIGPTRGLDSSSRFLASPASQAGGGVNIGRRPGRIGAAGGASAPIRVLRPR